MTSNQGELTPSLEIIQPATLKLPKDMRMIKGQEIGKCSTAFVCMWRALHASISVGPDIDVVVKKSG